MNTHTVPYCNADCPCHMDDVQGPRCKCGLELLGDGCPFCESSGLSRRFSIMVERRAETKEQPQSLVDEFDAEMSARGHDVQKMLPSPAQVEARKQFGARKRSEKREQKKKEKAWREVDQLPEDILHPALRRDDDRF